MSDKVRVSYAGYHVPTLRLLCKEPNFKVVYSFKIEAFEWNTLNPVNQIFKAIYRCRQGRKSPTFELLLLVLWKKISVLSTGIFRRYREYISILSEQTVQVIDPQDVLKITNYLSNTDILVVNAWELMSEDVICAPKKGSINVHPSKLPKYRGALPTLWTLKNGDSESAVTYMILGQGVDSGNIIAQHLFPIEKMDNWLSLEKKIDQIVDSTLVHDIKKYLTNSVIPLTQNDAQASKTAKYADYQEIKWKEETSEEIYNKVGLYPYLTYDYCYFIQKGRRINVKKCDFNSNKFSLFKLTFNTKDGMISLRMFWDISIKDSLYFFF